MKRRFFIFVQLLIFAFGVSAQEKEAREIDAFGVLPCGDFESRMSLLRAISQNSPDSKIYVVYYGSRFRKENVWNKKTKNYDKIQLKYPHREDGLNWAKSISIYLTTENSYPTETRNFFKDKIVFLNGGFQENLQVEIWLVPKDAAPPKPFPTIDEKEIKFRKGKPIKTPDYTTCYD